MPLRQHDLSKVKPDCCNKHSDRGGFQRQYLSILTLCDGFAIANTAADNDVVIS